MEAKACKTHELVTAVVQFGAPTRTTIDDRTFGFCKLLVDRGTHTILGCHVVGERAVEIVQLAALCQRKNSLGCRSRHIPASSSGLRIVPSSRSEYGCEARPREQAFMQLGCFMAGSKKIFVRQTEGEQKS